MHDHARPAHDPTPDKAEPPAVRLRDRDIVLRTALGKRAAGAPTFSVSEAAALLSVSREHLYRLVRADAFPVLHVRLGDDQGRYVIPARAVELLLEAAAAATGRMDIAEWASTARASAAEGGGV